MWFIGKLAFRLVAVSVFACGDVSREVVGKDSPAGSGGWAGDAGSAGGEGLGGTGGTGGSGDAMCIC